MSDKAITNNRVEAAGAVRPESGIMNEVNAERNMHALVGNSTAGDTRNLVDKKHLPDFDLTEAGKHCTAKEGGAGVGKMDDYKEPGKKVGEGKVTVPGPADKVTLDKLIKQIDGEANPKPRH